MKKKYVAPRADKMEFHYADNVTASGGNGFTLREYINSYTGCNLTETDNWFLNFVRENGCEQIHFN